MSSKEKTLKSEGWVWPLSLTLCEAIDTIRRAWVHKCFLVLFTVSLFHFQHWFPLDAANLFPERRRSEFPLSSAAPDHLSGSCDGRRQTFLGRRAIQVHPSGRENHLAERWRD